MSINTDKQFLKEDTTLRPYQNKAKKEIYDSWELVNDIMFQMPTGTGKTRLFTSIIKDINDISIAKREPVKILIVAHRKELIDQIDLSLKKYRVAHSVFIGNKERRDSSSPVIVTSIQTISHKQNADERNNLRDKVKYIIIDEAHHAVANTYSKLWELFPKAKILGVTATPCRLSHEGFTKLFHKLILSPPVKQFIADGWLAPYSYYSLKTSSYVQGVIDSINEFDSFGDYKESALESAMDKDKIRAQLLDSYLAFAQGKKGIIYSINRTHSEHICEKFSSVGIKIVSIDAKTPKNERENLVNKFKRGDIDIIVNVNIFSEGFDCPDIEFIQLARPTKSLSMYLQQVGRGLRITEGKSNCVILDNVGMYSRFGLPDSKRMWNKHFNGLDVEEEVPEKLKHRNQEKSKRDLSEGTEQMILIQDINGNVYSPEEENKEVNTDKSETKKLTPDKYLDRIGFKTYGLLWWNQGFEDTYEGYIQEKGQYIISKLNINTNTGEVHRIRVARIAPTSWAFDRLVREHVENLQIIHFSGNYTVLTWTFPNPKKGAKAQRYFDYLGNEIFSPDYVENKYLEIKKDRVVEDNIDMPVKHFLYDCEYVTKERLFVITQKLDGYNRKIKAICRFPYSSVAGMFICLYNKFEVVKVFPMYIELKYNDNNKIKTIRFTYDGHQVDANGKLIPDKKSDVYNKAMACQIGNIITKELKALNN